MEALLEVRLNNGDVPSAGHVRNPLANHLQGCPRSFLKPSPESIMMRKDCVSLLENPKFTTRLFEHEKDRHECDKCK